MFNKFMQPYLENDDGANLGGSEGVTDAQTAEVQNDDSSEVPDTGASENDGVADQKPVQSNDDNARFAAARREAEAQARQLKDRQDNFAKQYGYNSFEEMEHAQRVQQYAEHNNIDPVIAEMRIKQEQLENMLAMQGHKSRIADEKRILQNEMYFKDLEPEIDATLKSNPTLDVKSVYEYIRGVKMPELLKKQTAAAQQRTLNNINNKSHIKPDGGGTELDSTNVDPEEWRIYSTLNKGAKKEDYLKFKKSIRS